MRLWSAIKNLSESKLTISSAIWIFIVPAIAKISDSLGVYSINGNEFEIVAPFSFVLLYFSAILFFFGRGVYVLFCPALIKDTNNYFDFKSKGMNEFVLSDSLSSLNEKDANEVISRIKNKIEFASCDKIDEGSCLVIEASYSDNIVIPITFEDACF